MKGGDDELGSRSVKTENPAIRFKTPREKPFEWPVFILYEGLRSVEDFLTGELQVIHLSTAVGREPNLPIAS